MILLFDYTRIPDRIKDIDVLSRPRKISISLAFLCLISISCWGAYSERLFAQPIWTPIGARRFLVFLCGYVCWSAFVLRFARRWFVLLTSIAALGWTTHLCGLKSV